MSQIISVFTSAIVEAIIVFLHRLPRGLAVTSLAIICLAITVGFGHVPVGDISHLMAFNPGHVTAV